MAVVIYALVRQIGVLYERVAPAGALAVNKQLNSGQTAPVLDLEDINSGNTITIGKPKSAGRSQLLFFVSPSCPICKTLLPVIKSSGKAENDWLDVVLASDGENTEMSEFIQKYELEHAPFVNSESLGRQYGVSKLPYGVLIDQDSIIKSMGIVNSREHLESLFNAKEQGVATIQEYINKRQIQESI
jgi:methylamine dehydrogenase accessory protein MauD